MSTNVITVTREFGSLGRPIAKMVAEKLGFEYYDRDIIELAAANMGEPVYSLSEYDDHKVTAYGKMMFPLGFGAAIKQTKLFEIQRNIIVDLAAKKDCVIVGRCSDFILSQAKHQNLYNVFIYAPQDARFNYCLKNLGFTQESAEKYIQKIDEARSSFYKKYTGERFDSVRYRNLLVDSSAMPIDRTAELIYSCAKIRFGL